MGVGRGPGVGHGAHEVSRRNHGLVEVAVAVVELVAEGTTQAEAQVEALVGGREVEVGLYFGNTGAAILLIVFVDGAVAIDVQELDVTGFGVGLQAIALLVHIGSGLGVALEDAARAVEIVAADGLALLGVGRYVVGAVDQTGGRQGLTLVGQVHHLVLRGGEVEADVVLELLDFVVPVGLKLDTLVANLSDVEDGVLIAGRGREALGDEQIFGLVDVVVDATGQLVIEHAVVETNVLRVGGLPLQAAVLHGPRAAARPGVATLLVAAFPAVAGADEGLEVVVAQGVLVTQATPADAELQVVHKAVFREEAFLAQTPTQGYRGEGTPAVVATELGGAVAADGGLQQIAAVEAIVHAAEEGGAVVLVARAVAAEGAAYAGIHGVERGVEEACGLVAVGQVAVLIHVVLGGLARHAHTVVGVAGGGEAGTGHGRHVVLAKLLGEGQHVLLHLLFPVVGSP